MNPSTRTTLLAALSVVLTSSALTRVYDDAGWLPAVVGAVLAVAAGGLLARRLRMPALLQPTVAVVLVGAYVSLVYARDTLGLLLLPTTETARRVGDLIGEGLLAVDEQAAPVTTTPGLVLLSVLGVAAIAALVDLVAVALRRPALAGLPLLALLAVPSGTLEGGVGWWPFVLGATGWLLLLMDDAGGRVASWGTALRPGAARNPLDESSLGRVGRRIGVAALGVAVIVPALVPGLEARLLAGGSGSGLGGSRTTVTYNPLTELGGQLRLPEPRPLLAYRTTDPTPDYLRLTTLDRFDDGTGWSSSELSADVRRDAVSRGIPVSSAVRGAPTTTITTAVRVQDLGGPWLPVPAVPTGVDIPGPWLWDSDSETVFSTRVDLSEVEEVYRVTASRVTPDPVALRRDQRVPEEVAPFAVAPEVSPYVQELTERVTGGAETTYDKVAALQGFFRDPDNGFVYSEDTDVPGIDAPNALETFLRGRRGFCEQYASAMAAMVRVLGVPARVAVGFTPGGRQDDGSFSVSTNDAHAWPEVWFSGAGWVRFEPTPRGEQVTTPGYSVPPAEIDDPGAAPAEPVPAEPAVPAPGAEDPAGPDPRLLEEDGGLGGADTEEGGFTAAQAGLVLLLLAVLATPALLAAVRRRRLWRDPGPEAAWAHVAEDAVDVGHRWRPADSPLAAAAHLVEERLMSGEPAAAVQRLAEQVEQSRYARPDAVAPVAVADLRHDVALVRGGLHAGAPTRVRWAARLLPTSALRWASSGTATAVADLLDRSDELVGDVTSRVRRRVRRTV
jgi:transglutaminase-like putative cysteine protease